MSPSVVTRRVKTITRSVRPLNISVEVNLYEVIEPWGSVASWKDVEPIYVAIEAGQIELEVMHVERMLSEEQSRRIEDVAKIARYYVAGCDSHARMTAVGALYLESLGKKVQWNGEYNGGRADASAIDGSIVVECGTIASQKVLRAMEEGIAILVIPYNLGCNMSDENQESYILPSGTTGDVQFDEMIKTHPQLRDEVIAAARRVRLGSVQFGYLFRPISFPKSWAMGSTGPDVAGEVAARSALPATKSERLVAAAKKVDHVDVVAAVIGDEVTIACAHGHVYEAKWAGKYCIRGECKSGVRRDPERRIEERGT